MRTGHRPLFTNLGRPFLTQLGERRMGNGASPQMLAHLRHQNCWPAGGPVGPPAPLAFPLPCILRAASLCPIRSPDVLTDPLDPLPLPPFSSPGGRRPSAPPSPGCPFLPGSPGGFCPGWGLREVFSYAVSGRFLSGPGS